MWVTISLLSSLIVCATAQSVDLRSLPDHSTPEAREAFARFMAEYQEFLRTHPEALKPKEEKIINPPDIDHERRLNPVYCTFIYS